MDEVVEVLVLIGMCLFGGAILSFIIWSWAKTNKRDGRNDQQLVELAQFVEERGWSHTHSVPGGADRYCGGAPLPIKGVDIPALDYIGGEFRGRAFCCFEYLSRSTDADGDRQSYYFTVFAVTMPTSVPRMTVRRPEVGDKMDARLFKRGHVVELGNPVFDKVFRVITDDEPFARNVLASYLEQFLTSDPRARDTPLRFHQNELITWYKGRLRPEQIEPKLDYLSDVLDRAPARAWRSA